MKTDDRNLGNLPGPESRFGLLTPSLSPGGTEEGPRSGDEEAAQFADAHGRRTAGEYVAEPAVQREDRATPSNGESRAGSAAVLICPGERPAVSALAQNAPLALVPILGKSLLEYWLDHLVDRGVRHVDLLASDRPEQIRAWLGDGVRWELTVEVMTEYGELTVAEARRKYRAGDAREWSDAPDDVMVMDWLPGAAERPLFRHYAGWFMALTHWLPKAASALDRVGLHQWKPGIWVGWHSRVSPDAELRAPCWIGENVHIGPRAIVGPYAIIENGTVLAADTEIADSVVGPETYVGELTEVRHSLAWGSALIDWQTGFCTRVPDAFLLSPLGQSPARRNPSGWFGRATAIALRSLHLPGAGYAALKAWLWRAPAPDPLLTTRLVPGEPRSGMAAVPTDRDG